MDSGVPENNAMMNRNGTRLRPKRTKDNNAAGIVQELKTKLPYNRATKSNDTLTNWSEYLEAICHRDGDIDK